MNKRGEITTNSTEIQTIIREYYEKLYTKQPKLKQQEIENLNRSITSNEIESVIKNFPTNKSTEPDGFPREFYQPFKEKLIPIILKLVKKKNKKRNGRTTSKLIL